MAFLPSDFGFDEGTSAQDAREVWRHHQLKNNFCSFFEAGDFDGVSLQTDLIPSEQVSKTAKDLKFVCELVCAARDVALCASGLHKYLLVPCGHRSPISEETLFGNVTILVKLLGSFLADLDALVMSGAACEMEASGLPLALSVGMAREWQKIMRWVNARILSTMLDRFVELLNTAAAACRAATPPFEALFSGNTFNSSMGQKMMKGKLATIVESHNKTHSILTKLNFAARQLSITPRLQDNDQTAEPIAVALNAMGTSSIAAVVAMGLEVMEVASTPGGATKALEFLRAHKIPKNTLRIPDCFWGELEAVGSLSGAEPSGSARVAAAASASNAGDEDTPEPLPAPPQPTLGRVKRSPSEAGSRRSQGTPSSAGAAASSLSGVATKSCGLKRRRKA